MAEEEKGSLEEIVKAVRDKLNDIEDRQLVNKLDIINLKNELDKVNLTSAPSSETVERINELSKIADKSDFIKKFDQTNKELRQIRSDFEKIEPVDTQSVRSEIDSLKKKVIDLGLSGPSGKGGGVKPSALSDIREEMAEIRKIAESTGKGGGIKPSVVSDIRDELAAVKKKAESAGKGGAVPEDLMDRISELEKNFSAMAAQKGGKSGSKEIQKILRRLDVIETGKPKTVDKKVPNDVADKVRKLDGYGFEIEKIKARIEKQSNEMAGLENEIKVMGATKASPVPVKNDFAKRIEGIEKKLSLQKQPKQAAAPDLSDIKKRLGLIEKASVKKKPDGSKFSLEEMHSIVENLKLSLEEQGKEIVDLQETGKTKAGKSGDAEMLDRIDSISNDLGAMKTKLDAVEQTSKNLGITPEALEDLKKMKGNFPVNEFTEMKEKMITLEDKLEKTGKLAAALKPIELPGNIGGGGDSTKIERRLSSLEDLVGKGINPQKIINLELKLDEIKTKLPEEITQKTSKQLDFLSKRMEGKIHEMDNIKQEMIESTVEALLAQPTGTKKYLDDKMSKKVLSLEDSLEKFKNTINPSEAKITTIVRDIEDKERQIDNLKSALKDSEQKNRKEMDSLSVELRVLNSKLGSMTTSVKGMEDSGTAGVMRDLEILKTKAEWLESTVQKFDLNPIYHKIEELEEKLGKPAHYFGGQQPIIIE